LGQEIWTQVHLCNALIQLLPPTTAVAITDDSIGRSTDVSAWSRVKC